MYKFGYKEIADDDYPVDTEVTKTVEVENISELFNHMLNFLIRAGWMPSQIEKELREIVNELDNGVTIEEFIY